MDFDAWEKLKESAHLLEYRYGCRYVDESMTMKGELRCIRIMIDMHLIDIFSGMISLIHCFLWYPLIYLRVPIRFIQIENTRGGFGGSSNGFITIPYEEQFSC